MRSISSDLARSALDAAPDAMIIMDAAGSIKYANRQISALFGYGHDEVIGRSIETLMPERFRARHVGHRNHYLASRRLRPMGTGLELFGLRHDGTEFPLEISLSPLEEGAEALVAAAIRDVTDRKRVEEELTVTRDAAEAMRELADRANQGKSRFLATASHDLRQPLQTLALLNGTLRRMVTVPNAADVLAQQEQAIGAMSRLLNALLDISKLESGAIKPEPTDFTVAAILEDLRSEFATLAADKGLQLQIDACADMVHSDPSLVEQILRNLLANALKYTPEGFVRVRCENEAAVVRIEVADTGIGIPSDQLPYIYDEFFQVGVPANSARDGYGLGLTIVQRLVSLLTLKLDVKSEVGRGTAFSLELPAGTGRVAIDKGARSSPQAPLKPRHAHVADRNVLLVEDNAAVRRATGLLLELEGYRVASVASLSEATRHVLEGNPVDLLITDYHLGEGGTGSEVIEAVRRRVGDALPVILATGDTSSAIKQLARDAHLRITSKPINADDLLALVGELLAASTSRAGQRA